MWLEDSAAAVDLVVEGRVEQGNPRTIAISRVLGGAIEGKSLPLAPPYRCRAGGEGIWMLVRTAGGYVGINPTDEPLGREEWERHAASSRSTIDAYQRALVQEEEGVVSRHLDERRDGETVRRSLVVRCVDGGVTIERLLAQDRIFHRSCDSEGNLAAIHRTGADGAGVSMAFADGRAWSYAAMKSGMKHGVSREFYRHGMRTLREEAHWRNGIRHGLARQWDERGNLISETTFEDGLVAPVVRYRGPTAAEPPAKLAHTETGVSYQELRPIAAELKVGMTLEEVSQALQLDFSPASGIHFPYHTRKTYLHVEFAEGKISRIRTGDNSVCFEPGTRE